jgi:Tol biopolymer transport system component
MRTCFAGFAFSGITFSVKVVVSFKSPETIRYNALNLNIYRKPVKITYLVLLFITIITFACKTSTEPISLKQNPELSKIVFVSDRPGYSNKQIYLMNSDGSDQVKITNDSNEYIHPVFSPDGSKIIFFSHTVNYEDEIYSVSLDGTNFINLSNSAGSDNLPAYNQDGSKIVFTSTRDGNREIYIMDPHGNNQTRLTFNSEIDHSPQFVEGSSKILYFSSDSTFYDYNIHIMDLDGNNNKCLNSEFSYYCLRNFISDGSFSIYDSKPSISPDGSKITFMSYNHSQSNYEIFMMDSNGENPSLIKNIPGYNLAPVFSPDGSKIIFRSHRENTFDIYKMNLDGGQQVNLTQGIGHAYFADFSQNGLKILFYTDKEQFYKIWTMNLDGSNQTQLTFGDYNDYYPRYQPIL